MGKIDKFEDLVAWQKARQLVADVYQMTNGQSFSRDYSLKDQVRRSAVSVMSNIAEGFDRGNPREFHQFLVIAKGSCAELRSQVYIASDVGYIAGKTVQDMLLKTRELALILGGLRAAVDRKRRGEQL
jgi:four helix bundle protein